MLCRFIATIGLVSLMKCCSYESKHPNPLTFKELVFIWYSGLIRGAIAFGLVLRIEESFPGRDLIVTTCLSLVLLSTIIFGSTIGLVGSCLFPKETIEGDKDFDGEPGDAIDEDEDDVIDDGMSSDSSERSGFMGPNEQPMQPSEYSASQVNDDQYQRATGNSQVSNLEGQDSQVKTKKRQRKGCGHYMQRFDEFCMKPIFIRKYNPEKAHMAEAFVYDYIEKGEQTEKQFISGASSGGGRLRVQKTHVESGRHLSDQGSAKDK